jgi:hypothetical protein
MDEEEEPSTQQGLENLSAFASPIEEPIEQIDKREPLSTERPMEPTKSQEEGVTSQEVRDETWKKLVDFVRAKKPVLGAFLVMGSLMDVSDEKIEIGFEKDSFHYDRISENENRSQLEAICQEFLKRNVKVIISALDQKAVLRKRTVPAAEGPLPNNRQPEKGTEENPLIQEALRLFNGRIVEG